MASMSDILIRKDRKKTCEIGKLFFPFTASLSCLTVFCCCSSLPYVGEMIECDRGIISDIAKKHKITAHSLIL